MTKIFFPSLMDVRDATGSRAPSLPRHRIQGSADIASSARRLPRLRLQRMPPDRCWCSCESRQGTANLALSSNILPAHARDRKGRGRASVSASAQIADYPAAEWPTQHLTFDACWLVASSEGC